MRPVGGFRPRTHASRSKYRLQRLLLTPSVRVAALVTAVSAASATAAFLLWESSDGRIANGVSTALSEIMAQPEFMVTGVSLRGASAHLEREIGALLPADFPASAFSIDVKKIKRSIESLNVIESASVLIDPNGRIEISVVERSPVLIWRNGARLSLLGDGGLVIGETWNRNDYPALRLVAGTGADRAMSEALELYAALEPAGGAVRGLVRVGERRWDVVLDRSRRVLLPEDGSVQAANRLMELDRVDRILSREIAIVDLRVPGRMKVRLTASGMQAMQAGEVSMVR